MRERPEVIRLAAVADLHYRDKGAGELRALFHQISEAADIAVLCGDLTDRGLAAEAKGLADDLVAALRIPAVGVLGNHDVESGEAAEVTRILCAAGLQLLDGDAVEIDGVGFAGAKGFGGGFGRSMLQPWGEPVIKQFVQEAIDEALKLERGLARLRTSHRVAVLHYAPVRATVEGEPAEIFPYLGSTRLAEPIDAFRASLVVHGHAHHGSPAGATSTGIPVYNCSRFVQARHAERPFLLLELPRVVPAPAAHPDRLAERSASTGLTRAVAGD